MLTFVAFDHQSHVNQTSLVQPGETCSKTREMGLIRPWLSIREGGPEILKDDVPDMVLAFFFR